MREASDQLDQVLSAGSYAVRLVVDSFYSDERTIVNVPVDPDTWALSWDVEQQLPFQGGLQVDGTDEAGQSLSPQALTDPLAPFGQEVAVLAKISFGPIFTETVLLGRFRIDSVPTAADSWFGFAGRPYVSGSIVTLTLVDALDSIARWGFRWPGVPTYTASTWDEVAFITDLPVAVNLTDKPTPANLVYQASSGGRLTAVRQLMSYLGGVAVVNSRGELTSLPFDGGPSTHTLQMGSSGTVIGITGALDSSDLPNELVGTYQDDDGNPIYATATISSGPLAYGGPYPKTTAYDSDDTVTTTAEAVTRVRTVLQQRLTSQTIRYTLTVLFDPRTEIGDVVTVNGPQAQLAGGGLSDPAYVLLGRVVSVSMAGSNSGLMGVVVDVGAALEAQISVSTP